MADLNLVPGHSVRFFDELDSTNEEALRLVRAGKAQEGLWIVANTQTKGRGRLGREWVSDKGNLFASHLFQPKIPASRAPEFSFLAAVAVHHCISNILSGQERISFKWPNDVLLEGKKVAGILVESETGAENWVVVGIGINITSAPEKVRFPATYLQALNKEKVSKNKVLEKLSRAFEAALLNLYQPDGFALIRNLWLMSAEGLGYPVRMKVGNEELRGVFEDIGPKGEFVLKLPNGGKKAIISGEILELNT